jgi:serine/threonine-protein kinase
MPDGTPLGIIHRDVSPQNLIVSFEGNVKVVDFGIAKAEERETATRSGTIKGKFAYMSPEQCAGKALDRRSDLFSVGVVLFEALTLRKLFRRASTLATMRAVLDDPIPRVREFRPECTQAIDAVVARSLERNLASRWATALDFRSALRDALKEAPDASPDQTLSATMRALFADRIAEKSEMLARLRDGSSISVVPAPEVDLEIELPSVVFSETVVDAPKRPSMWMWLAGAAAVAVAAVSIGVVFASSSKTEATEERESPPPAPMAEARAPAPAKVRISVDSRPSGATVFIGDEARGRTPVDIELDRASARSSFRLELDGFVTAEETFVPDVDQRFVTVLERRRSGRTVRRAAMREAPAMAPPEFRLLP